MLDSKLNFHLGGEKTVDMKFKIRTVGKLQLIFITITIIILFESGVFLLHFCCKRTNFKRKANLDPTQLSNGPLNPVTNNSFEDLDFKDFPKNQRKQLILYWSGVRGHKVPVQKSGVNHSHFWPFFYAGKKGECPVPCILTSDKSKASQANAFVVHAREPDIWNMPPIENLAPWILQINENPVYTPSLRDPKIMSKFNLLVSYRLDSDFPSPMYPMPELDPPIPFGKRLGNVLAIFSKCEPVRTEYLRQLMKYIHVDSYGFCLKNRDGLIGLYGKKNNKYVFKDHKLVLSRYYKFSLVFMNQDCDYFVDDRLYHALTTGSVPVYMGTDKVDEFLPGNLRNAIIKVKDFKSPKHLADYLSMLSNNETAFNKYLEWKWKGFGDISKTKIGRWWKPKYPLFCQVCMAVAKGKLHRGLKVDKCEPRRYKDWGLEDPNDRQCWFCS